VDYFKTEDGAAMSSQVAALLAVLADAPPSFYKVGFSLPRFEI
jgi:hypothetical protein